MLGTSNRSKHLAHHLLVAMALIITLPALGQDAADDTRPYPATSKTGLSLKLDLGLPDASRQHGAQQPTAVFSGRGALESTADSPQPQPATVWPYYLLGLLALGASATWFLRQPPEPAPAVVPEAVPPLYPKPGENKPTLNPFGFDESSGAIGADSEGSASPEEQSRASIELLKAHIEQSPGESPVPWLLLLDLLHRMGKAEEYETSRRQCKQYFNIDMPAYKKIKTSPKKQGIESYPHIMSKLMRLWPGEEAAAYLNALLHDSRDGSRVGFDLATYHDIALLRSVLENASEPQ